MKTRPNQWTHHHSLRLFHISFFVSWVFILATVTWGGSLVFFLADAEQDTVAIAATVPDVDFGPTVIGGGGGGTPSPLAIAPSPEPEEEITPNLPGAYLVVDIPAGIEKKEVVVNGIKLDYYVYHTQYPRFSGSSNFRNALISLEIHSSVLIKGNTYTDDNGRWSWRSPEPVTEGPHTLFASVKDSETGQLKYTTKFNFLIDLQGVTGKKTSQPNLVNESGKTGTLFDVVVKIPRQFKIVPPGDDISVVIQLINFGKAGSPVDVKVVYSITDHNGKLISERSETLAVATQLSVLKTFTINHAAREGEYTITVKVPSKDIIASGSDSFTVQGRPILALSSQAKVDFTVVFQALLILLFLSILILYFEYNKVVILSNVIRKVSERDLISEVVKK
jgi:hypothetical protein